MRQGLHMQQHTMQPSTKKKEEKEWGRWLSPSRLPLIDNWKPSSPCCSIDLMNSRLVYYYYTVYTAIRETRMQISIDRLYTQGTSDGLAIY